MEVRCGESGQRIRFKAALADGRAERNQPACTVIYELLDTRNELNMRELVGPTKQWCSHKQMASFGMLVVGSWFRLDHADFEHCRPTITKRCG